MQANPHHVKVLFLLKNVDMGDSLEKERERKGKPKGVHGVFYSLEPRGGSEVQGQWEGCRSAFKEEFRCFRPCMGAAKPIFYTFSYIQLVPWKKNRKTRSCKMRIFNGGLFACKSWQKSDMLSMHQSISDVISHIPVRSTCC